MTLRDPKALSSCTVHRHFVIRNATVSSHHNDIVLLCRDFGLGFKAQHVIGLGAITEIWDLQLRHQPHRQKSEVEEVCTGCYYEYYVCINSWLYDDGEITKCV